MPKKSFRGLIATGEQDTIALHTNDGSTGYRITKFELIANTPGSTGYEHVVKIYKTKQTTVDGTIDFSDQTLLAAGYLEGNNSSNYQDNVIIVFDQEIFNQDVYVTQKDSGSEPCNYYIEMEQIKLSLDENTVATLKDIRNTATP